MNVSSGLAALLDDSAARFPDRVAVKVPGGGELTYRELRDLSDRFRDRLLHLGVRRGDRVGLRLHKSLDAVAVIFGTLKAGAAYVPVDAESPAARSAFILNDCAVKVLVSEGTLHPALARELEQVGATPIVITLDRSEAASLSLETALDVLDREDPAPGESPVAVDEGDLAYILYTSGSTGKPKGVVLTHGNATSFIDWCSRTFGPRSDDVFSSHAPFHFDLSILDIYVPLKHGATLVLIGENLGKNPDKLAAVIASERISVWYSTPSILSLLANYGRLERHDCSALRLVFFAGEVFPVPQFRVLKQFWSGPRYFNLYGPTETNVCTFYEVPQDESWAAMDTFPIGRVCDPNRGMVVDVDGTPVRAGEPGELVIHGPNVMNGYWNLPEQNRSAFLTDAHGQGWYHTGDIVTEYAPGMYRYLGRKDRMVKRRGYRVELGEVEAGLLRSTLVREAAVVAVADAESGVRLAAFVTSGTDAGLTIVGLKKISSEQLPPYMIPDAFFILDALPRTSTDKVDLQKLKQLAETGRQAAHG